MSAPVKSRESPPDAAVTPHAPETQHGGPPPVVTPPPGNPRFPLLDSLRAIAALSVLTAHAAGQSGAIAKAWYGPVAARFDIGVTIFFLLSGFLLFRPYFRASYHHVKPPRAADYARRRTLRIVPAYWLALTVLAIYPGLVGVFTGDWWEFYGFFQIYDHTTILSGIGQAWSLCVEASFYALLPLYALVGRRLTQGWDPRRRVRIELVALATLAVASALVRALAGSGSKSVIPATLLGTFTWFALGMGLAVASVALERRNRQPGAVRLITGRPSLAWAAALVTFLVLCTQFGLERRGPPEHLSVAQWFVEHWLYGLVALFLLLPAIFGDSAGGAVRRVLGNGVLAWLGLVSYGIFLWNLAVVTVLSDHGVGDWIPSLRFPVLEIATIVVSVAIAAASYYVVERPILRFKDRRPPRSRAAPPAPMAAAGASRDVGPGGG